MPLDTNMRGTLHLSSVHTLFCTVQIAFQLEDLQQLQQQQQQLFMNNFVSSSVLQFLHTEGWDAEIRLKNVAVQTGASACSFSPLRLH